MILGVNFVAKGVHLCVCGPVNGGFNLVTHERFFVPATNDTLNKLDSLHTKIQDVVQLSNIRRIGLKVHYNLQSQHDLFNHGAPVGVLALVAEAHGCEFHSYTKRKLTSAKSFSLPKGTNVVDYVSNNFQDGSPHWQEPAKVAFLAAWAVEFGV